MQSWGKLDFAVPAPSLLTAVQLALETDGYRITLVNKDKMIVRTAPKEFGTSASGGPYRADPYTESLAWRVEVIPVGPTTARVEARAMPYVNGQPATPNQRIKVHFDKFWTRVDDMLRDASAS